MNDINAYRIRFRARGDVVAEFVLRPGYNGVVGSSGRCTFQLPDGLVEPEHARLSMDHARSLRVEDCGSGKGTWLNNGAVRKTLLQVGDLVRLGECQGIVEVYEDPSEELQIGTPNTPFVGDTETYDFGDEPSGANRFRSIALEQLDSELPKQAANVAIGQDDSTMDSELIRHTSRFEELEHAFTRVGDDNRALVCLYELVRRTQALDDRRKVLEQLARVILERFGQASVVTFLGADSQGRFAPVQSLSRKENTIVEGEPGSVSQTLVGHLIAKREALSFTDADPNLAGAESVVISAMRAGMLAPLRDDGGLRGIVQVESHEAAMFTPNDLDVLTLMANHAALVIANLEMTANMQKLNGKLEESNQQLEKMNAGLEAMVIERTSELEDAKGRAEAAQERAEEAAAMAEGANQAKSVFLANMSHELRTPMNAIIGYAEMLLEDAEDQELEELGEDLSKIRSAGKHLLGLINDVLDLSKVEAGGMDLYLEDFEVAPMAQECLALVGPQVEKKGTELKLEVEGEVGMMHADEKKVRQSLVNLLSNAVKFTDEGSVTLRVTRKTDEECEWVRFDVVDTGIGIKEEHLDHLFEAFHQADASTTRKYGGTGLGLALSRSYCQLMGGTLTVESVFGEGSTFTARLPAAVPEEKPAA